MIESREQNARSLALLALERVEKDRAYLDRLVDQTLKNSALRPEERGLFTELSYGVVRHQRLLDFYLEQYLDRKIFKLDLATRSLLRLGAYQILCLDRIPGPAAVNESVKLSAPRAKGLINAVLRRISENKNTLKQPDQISNPVTRLGVKYSHPDLERLLAHCPSDI